MTDRASTVPQRRSVWIYRAVLAAALVVCVVIALRFGVPAAVLWAAFVALVGAVMLFWESLRVALDPTVEDGDEADLVTPSVAGDLEDRKRAALRALRDIEFERSIRRLSNDDYEALRERYRAEARDALRAIDEAAKSDLGSHLLRAEAMVARALGEVGGLRDPAPVEPPPTESPRKKGRKGGKGKRGRESGRIEGTIESPAVEASAEVIESSEYPESTEASERDGETRTCPDVACATENDADAMFCKKCGARLEAVA